MQTYVAFRQRLVRGIVDHGPRHAYLLGARPDRHDTRLVRRDGLRGVENQVHDHLLNLSGIGFNGGKAGLEREPQAHLFRYRGAQQRGHIAHGLRKIHGLDDVPALAGVRHELARQIGGPFALLEDDLDLLPAPAGNFSVHQARVTHDAGQAVVEIMRDPAGQDADALQFLCLPKALLGAFVFGDIQEHCHHAARAAALIQHRHGVAQQIPAGSIPEATSNSEFRRGCPVRAAFCIGISSVWDLFSALHQAEWRSFVTGNGVREIAAGRHLEKIVRRAASGDVPALRVVRDERDRRHGVHDGLQFRGPRSLPPLALAQRLMGPLSAP